MDHHGFARWNEAYDRAGILDGEQPPEELRVLAPDALVVASDMVRAQQSAALLAARFTTSPLLREVRLVVPACGGWRLPFALWALVVGVRWAWGRRRSDPAFADDIARADEAAAWLESLANEHGTVIAVTHGAVRRYLADALAARGWIVTLPRKRTWAPWSAWSATRPR